MIEQMNVCWKERNKPLDESRKCEMSKCCYDASCQAVFDYWKFAHSKEWKELLARELAKERENEKVKKRE